MPRSATFLIVSLSLIFSTSGETVETTTNPIASHYSGPEGYPAWTDAIHWERVIDMKRYAKGATNFEKFENARDELAVQGGGVLYYPAGTYEFTEGPFDGPNGRGLMLKSGVVIRGAAPGDRPRATGNGKLDIPTRFVFGFQKKTGGSVPRDWNLIGLAPAAGQGIKDVSNVGICWVHLVGAVIYFGPELKWGKTWGTARCWKSAYAKPAWADRKPDGTHPYDPFMGALPLKEGGGFVGSGRGRLIFGCVLQDAALLNDFDTCGRREAPDGFGPDGFHMAKFAPRIGAYGSRVFIANNVLAKSAKAFTYPQTTVQTIPQKGNAFKIGATRESQVLWDYGRTCGIDVNKDLLGWVRSTIKDPGEGGYFEEGVAVIDNRVFNHGHKGFNLSGKWMVVRGNRNERAYLKGGDDIYGIGGGYRLTLDGFIESAAGGGGMISDNLSRAFDLAGWNLWVDQNSFNDLGSDPGNDGEGILCQTHGGTHWHSWAITRNVHERGSGEKSYIGAWDAKVNGALIAWNKTPGWVGVQHVSKGGESDMAFVANEAGKVQGPPNALKEPPEGTPTPPRDVKTTAAGDAVRITWTDASDNEVGFRVERSLDGGKTWYQIAYRPPRIEGHKENPQAWLDFLAPSGKELVYRVVALDAGNSDAGASAPVGPVKLRK